MPRTTVSAVRSTTGVTAQDVPDVDVELYIADAAVWVAVNLEGRCPQATEDTLEVVERYLAAHFMTARAPQLQSATRGDVSERYTRGGETTTYLETAAGMDPCGIVDDLLLAKRPRVRFRVGKGFGASK